MVTTGEEAPNIFTSQLANSKILFSSEYFLEDGDHSRIMFKRNSERTNFIFLQPISKLIHPKPRPTSSISGKKADD